MKTTLRTYGQPSIGCYLDHGNYNVDELNVRTVELAKSMGYAPDRETLNCLARFEHEVMKEDDSEWLSEMADSAIDWLNEQETRPFMYWANDGDGEANAFGLWPNVDGAREDVGFVSGRKQDYPAADYRGEWLHVSDHGNATLYVRTGPVIHGKAQSFGFKDVEIWSVV